MSSNLSINSSGEITLTPGVNARDDPYIYSIAADISNPNYNDLTVTSGPYDLTITKSTSIGNYQINTTIGDAYTYGQTASGACSLSIVPPAGTTVT